MICRSNCCDALILLGGRCAKCKEPCDCECDTESMGEVEKFEHDNK